MMVDETLVQQLKAYIKANYELVSVRLPGELGRFQGTRPQGSFEKLSAMLDSFLKDKRDRATFSSSLERLRVEKDMTPSQLYKGAWIDKKLYSKIIGDRNYRPSKNTVIAFGFSLKLTKTGMDELLETAGFLLNNNSVFDLVIWFCLENYLYDLHDVNALLLQVDQKVLCKE
jgi:hypothetical protein